MNTLQKIAKNAFSLLVSNIIAQILGFLATIYLARLLGPSDFGKLNFAIAFVLYFSLISTLGLPILGIRMIANDISGINKYSGDILSLRVCLSILSVLLIILISHFLKVSWDAKYLIVLFGIGLIPQALSLDWSFQGAESMGFAGLSNILKSTIYLLLVFFFVKSAAHLLLIPLFLLIGGIIASIFLISVFIYKFGSIRWSYDINLWLKLAKESLTIGFALMVTQIFFNIDILMLAFFKSESAVGFYTSAYKIVLFLSMIRTAYAQAIFPAASRYYKSSLYLWKTLLQLSSKLMITLTFPVAIGGTILANRIMTSVYGTAYDQGVTAFQILIWNVALISVNIGYVRGLLSCGKENRYAYVVTIASVFNLISNIILIPCFGLVGAAVSTVITQLVVFIGVYREFGKIIKIEFAQYLYKPLCASIVMSSFLLWGTIKIDLDPFLLIFGGSIIYFFALLIFKGVTSTELVLIRDLFRVDAKGNTA